MVLKIAKLNPDSVGVLISALCIVHCLVTPFIFITHVCSTVCSNNSPVWWSAMDYLFVGISFLAVMRSAQTTSKKWMSILLWLTWFAFFLFMLNEKLEIISLHTYWLYAMAFSLTLLHIYNRSYCQCQNNKCCSENKQACNG